MSQNRAPSFTCLYKRPENRFGEPRCKPLIILSDREVEIGNRHGNMSHREKRLAIIFICILKRNVKRDSLGSKLDIEQTRIFVRHESSLFRDPKCDIRGFEMDARDSKTE